jgi:Tetratricopeptide repeat.
MSALVWGSKKWDERKAEEWPWQLLYADRKADLMALLLNVSHLYEILKHRDNREVINYWLAVKGLSDSELDKLIVDSLEREIDSRKEDRDDLILFVDRIAALFDKAGLYREPLMRLRTLSVELEEASIERSEESLISSLQWLADSHRDQGHIDAAIVLTEQCLKARERLLRLAHLSTYTTVNNLGLLYSKKGKYEQAEGCYKRCLENLERLLGVDHPDTLTAVNNLAVLFQDKGDFEQAKLYCLRCLEDRRRQLGCEHPDSLIILGNLGSLYRAIGDYKQRRSPTNGAWKHRSVSWDMNILPL